MIYIDGDYYKEENARISVKDVALGRGYATFDYFQVYKGRPIFMKEHVNRFKRSISLMRLQVKVNEDLVSGIVYDLIRLNGQDSAGVKLIATGGISPDGYSIGKGSLIIILYPFKHPSKDLMEKGVKLLSYNHQRNLPEIKSINYMYALYLSDQLYEASAIEPLFYTEDSVRETSRSNIMAVINGQIITPKEKILRGITRQKIIDLPDITVIERDISINEMKGADEVFLCGTTKRVIGVVKIDGQVIGKGQPGPITRTIFDKIYTLEKTITEV